MIVVIVGVVVVVVAVVVICCDDVAEALRARGWGESSNDRERAVEWGMGVVNAGDMGDHLGQAGHGDVGDEGAHLLT